MLPFGPRLPELWFPAREGDTKWPLDGSKEPGPESPEGRDKAVIRMSTAPGPLPTGSFLLTAPIPLYSEEGHSRWDSSGSREHED